MKQSYRMLIFDAVFIVIGLPILSYLGVIIFCALHIFGAIECSWWWLGVPGILFVGGTYFDIKTETTKVGKR